MKQPSVPKLIWDALDAGETAQRFSEGKTFEDYETNQMFHDAVERNLIIVGEALAQMRRHHPEVAHRIPSVADIVAFRNILVHGYDVVEDATVWTTLRDDVPLLIEVLRDLLAELG